MNQLKFSICLETKQNNNSVEALYDEVYDSSEDDLDNYDNIICFR